MSQVLRLWRLHGCREENDSRSVWRGSRCVGRVEWGRGTLREEDTGRLTASCHILLLMAATAVLMSAAAVLMAATAVLMAATAVLMDAAAMHLPC